MSADTRFAAVSIRMARLADLLDALANESSRRNSPNEGALWVAAEYAADSFNTMAEIMDAKT